MDDERVAQLELVGVGVWGGVVFGGGGVLARGGAIALLPGGAVRNTTFAAYADLYFAVFACVFEDSVHEYFVCHRSLASANHSAPIFW